ncbi:MAG: ABC transporter substrate-binding protein [Heliobacteriaceae bacterium]|jgi:peptide/nickel transport system substrate-binding protein|nr:ABC transporter substrate-binding protein [Heliobacteriaceae bacterium]
MKRIGYILVVLLLLLLCVNRDLPVAESEAPQTAFAAPQQVVFPPRAKTVTLKGVDYLQSQAPAGKFGGALVMSTIGEGPKTFNPFNTKDATSAALSELMYDGLVTTDPQTGETVPKLAKSYEIKGNDYIMHLRRGIKWSDGKPITADDVVFTWRNIIFDGFGNTSARDSVVIDGKLPTVRKADDYTVIFTTPQPFAPFLRLLAGPIAPKHVFEPAVKKGKAYFETFFSTNANPKNFVTSGPFRMVEYVPAQRVVYERNPDYYIINTENRKLPYLDKVIYLIVGDLNNEVLKFEGGEIDLINLHGANAARFKARERYSDFAMYNLGPDTGTMYMGINQNNRRNEKGEFYVNSKKQKWFRDKNFRQAVDFALDRKNMVLNIANGLAAPLFTPESLNSVFLNKTLKPYGRNLDKSRELLKKSGFYQDGKGRLTDKYGNRVEFDLYTNAGNTEREAIGVMVKQDLEDLGMKVNFKPIEFNSLVNKLVSTLDWDMVIMGLTGSPLEPNGGKNVWLSDGTLHVFNQRLEKDRRSKRLPYEARIDELFKQGALAVKFEDRKKYYDEYQKIVYDEKPFIYIYSPIRIAAMRKKFKNVFPSSLGGLTHNVEEIYAEDGK